MARSTHSICKRPTIKMKTATRITIYIATILLVTLFIYQPVLAQTIYIEVDDLLVRSGPATSYELIGHVNQGETYSLVDEEDDWFAISFDNQTGWVSQQYASKVDQADIEHEDTEDTPEQDESEIVLDIEDSTFRIPVKHLHLRAEATTQSEISTVLTRGDEVTIIDDSNQWLHVQTQDDEGYIPAWLLNHREPDQQEQPSLFEKVIVIDAGHGGYDVGAISITEEYEKKYSLFTTLLLKEQLEREGAIVHLTRKDDQYYALSPRAAYANYLDADVFLSIHYNSEPQYPSANGINTYYRNPRDLDLANDVHQGILDATGANDREVLSGDYQVLRVSKQPGLLLELGFISNEAEEQRIRSLEYQNKLSDGIIEGLQSYFSNK